MLARIQNPQSRREKRDEMVIEKVTMREVMLENLAGLRPDILRGVAEHLRLGGAKEADAGEVDAESGGGDGWEGRFKPFRA